MFKFATLLAFVSGALLAAAQEPAYKGQLLIQPNNNSGKCLQVDNANGAKVTLQTCTGNANQQFTFVNGQVKIYGSKCLDVIDGKNVNGQKFQIWDCDPNNLNVNQKFYYTPWGDKHLAWADHGRCMDLTDGKLDDGTLPQLWDCSSSNSNQLWDVGYMANNLPDTSENGQTGTNKCGTTSSQSSMCQTAWMNDADDFCLWAPHTLGSVGDKEREVVAWCTKSGRGTRVIPNGTLKGVHFVRTPDYVQVTGVGDLTKLNIPQGDAGGELDPHGPDNNGNPVGGLLFGNTFGANRQYHEWTSFISDSQFCFRACTGPNARENCQHIYDTLGCNWNMPANYDEGTFESCKGDNDLPMGIYGTSTFHQGDATTPAAHPVAPSSSCTAFASVSSAPVKRGYAPQADRKRLTFDAVVTPIA